MAHRTPPSGRRRFLGRATTAGAGLVTVQAGSSPVVAQPATDVIVRPPEGKLLPAYKTGMMTGDAGGSPLLCGDDLGRLTIVQTQIEAALFETAPPA